MKNGRRFREASKPRDQFQQVCKPDAEKLEKEFSFLVYEIIYYGDGTMTRYNSWLIEI